MIQTAEPALLADLAQFSAQLGADLCWVQGGGGNTSLKEGERLWIKASGTWLAQALEKDIFVPVAMPRVRARLTQNEDDCALGATLNDDPRRASIETSLHALLPHRVVAHVHCVDTLRWSVRQDGEAQLIALLEGLNWLWIPYRRPGAPLANEVAARLSAHGGTADVLVLQNHGLAVGAESSAAALGLLEDIRGRLAVAPRAPQVRPSPSPAPAGYHWSDDAAITPLAFDEAARTVARKGVLYPDHAVFLGAVFSEVRDGEDAPGAIARWRAAFGAAPGYLVVPGQGVLVSDQLKPGALAMLQCLGLVTARMDAADPVHVLGEPDVAALLNWDAEVYRRKFAGLGA